MSMVLLSSLKVGDYFTYKDDGFGHDPKSEDYRVVIVYGQVVGTAPLLDKPKSVPIRYAKKDYRPNSGKVFIEDTEFKRISLSSDIMVTPTELVDGEDFSFFS